MFSKLREIQEETFLKFLNKQENVFEIIKQEIVNRIEDKFDKIEKKIYEIDEKNQELNSELKDNFKTLEYKTIRKIRLFRK